MMVSDVVGVRGRVYDRVPTKGSDGAAGAAGCGGGGGGGGAGVCSACWKPSSKSSKSPSSPPSSKSSKSSPKSSSSSSSAETALPGPGSPGLNGDRFRASDDFLLVRDGVVGVLRDDEGGMEISTQERTSQYELWLSKREQGEAGLHMKHATRPYHLPLRPLPRARRP